MPKKMKLDLNGLKIKSFVTSLEKDSEGRIKGGATVPTNCFPKCSFDAVCETEFPCETLRTCETCETCDTCHTNCGSCFQTCDPQAYSCVPDCSWPC